MRRVIAVFCLSGCVSSGAGYDDLASLVHRRTSVQIDVRDVEDAPSEDVQALLRKPLTLDSAARVALLQNPGVQIELERVGMARADLVSQVRLPNPRAHGRVLFEQSAELELGVELDVMGLLAMPSLESAASHALDATVLESAGRIVDVAWTAKVALVRAQSAKAIADSERSFLEAAFASGDAAERLFDAGNITELEALERKAVYEESRLTSANAELLRVAALEALARACGVTSSSVALSPLRPPVEPAKVKDLSTLAIEKNLDLRAIEARYASAAGRSDAATLRSALPSLGLGVAAELREGEWGVGPSIGLELPLFYQGQGERDSVSSEMRKLRAEHASLLGEVSSRAREIAVSLEVAGDRYRFYRDTLVPLRRKALAEAELQYNAMNLSVFQLIVAKQALLRAERGAIESLEQFWLAVFDFDRLRLGRLPGTRALSKSESPARAAHESAH